jgi:VanZ family protein
LAAAERAVRGVLLLWLGLPVWLRALAPFVVMGSLWISSSISPTPSPADLLRSLLHNGAHVVVYAVLAGAWLLAHSPQQWSAPARRSRAAALRSVLLATAYGAVDEWHQSFVPDRVCSVADLLADASGAALAVSALLALLRDDVVARRLVWWCAGASVASVAAATWLPW